MATITAAASGNFTATGTWTGGVVPGTGDIAVINVSGRTVTVNSSVTCQEFQIVGGGTFAISSGVTMTASVAFRVTKTGDSNLSGFLFSGTSGTSASMSGPILNDPSGLGGSPGLTPWGVVQNASSGTLNIAGDVNVSTGTGGANIYGVWNRSTGRVNITGNVLAGVSVNPGIQGVRNESTGTIEITGNVTGGSPTASSNSQCGAFNLAGGTIRVIGAVNGGVGTASPGIISPAAGIIEITGNITGGLSVGLSNAGTATITGTATGGTAAAGISNSGTINASSGALTVKGNAFGAGAVVTAQYGLVNTNVVYVSNIEYGDLGMSPISGAVYLNDVSTNQAIMYRSGLSKKTLVDASATASYVPAISDVRLGTVYNIGNYTGTCAIPAAGSVALGVAVDNTTGTAALTPASVWGYLTASATVSGSMGERLKNAGTVQTIGQQIADSTV